ncbi:MAG: hypothetical protein KAI66_01195 [Lentisphaeria bacterium]|nr:hypothetical protein [Lentisphaeria bacterium]
MSTHIDAMKRAIEFGSPPYIPMELVDVPFLYDAYGTLDPKGVAIPKGAENFDSAWCTYHWTFRDVGEGENGEVKRTEEWGCRQVVPDDGGIAYSVVEKPEFASLAEVEAHPWPDPELTNPFFEQRQRIIAQHYQDRFVCGFIDPGPFLVAFNLLGYDGLLLQLYDNLALVKTVVRRVVDYQLALVPKFKAMGAHMVNVIDEVAGTGGLMFSPALFREHFLPMYAELVAEIHRHDMYASMLLDGNIADIFPDVMALELDQILFAQPRATGIDTIADFCRGKRCVKMAADMMVTLANGTPSEIEAEVDEMVEKLNTPRGGLVFQALRWHRPEYDTHRVQAQIRAMNKYRKAVS